MSEATLGKTRESSPLEYGAITRFGRLSSTVPLGGGSPFVGLPGPHQDIPDGLGSSRFARRYFGNRLFFLFLRLLRCFTSPGLPSFTYFNSEKEYMRLSHVGYPIGKSSGQCLLGSFPRLVAAGHVLHRLPLPRRPPFALVNPLLLQDAY